MQRIVWRDKATEPIETYELLTLTYGTASFLATRTMHQLADLEEDQFPKRAVIVQRNFYMDNLITGADSIEEASIICDQVAALLMKGGFLLRKWDSNYQDLLRSKLFQSK